MHDSALLEATGLCRRYRTGRGVVEALDRVDVSLARGELVVVRGPSGAGKSTLLFALGGMQRPSAGRVVLDGVDVYALSPARRRALRRARVGFVFQTMHLLPFLDAQANVELAVEDRRFAPQAARERLASLGLAERVHHRPDELSVGERQRVALARALASGPDLILADEPTGNLDPETAELVLAHLHAFQRDGGTVVLATHATRLGVLEPTRELRLNAGRFK